MTIVGMAVGVEVGVRVTAAGPSLGASTVLSVETETIGSACSR